MWHLQDKFGDFYDNLVIANGICYNNAMKNATCPSLNWNKWVSLWMGEETHPAWYLGPSCRWLHHDETIWNLGCMVGLDLRPEAMLSPLLLSIKRKLLYWDAQQFSFTDPVVVENLVLLASMWFIASDWLFSKSTIMKVQNLICNFLWGGEWILNNGQSCLEGVYST